MQDQFVLLSGVRPPCRQALRGLQAPVPNPPLDALDLSALLGEPLPLTLHQGPVTAGA
jgi:hypothetical protein